MNRTFVPKLLPFIVLMIGAMVCAFFSNTPALSPVQNSQDTDQQAGMVFEKAEPDSQQAGYFHAKVAPILEKCQPCHFKGGKMYAQLPFDDPQTIRRLGAQLFTRIKDNQEQAVIRAFLTPAEDSVKTTTGVSVSH